MSDAEGSTRGDQQSQKVRARVGEETANPVADCPGCSETHEASTRTRARSKAEACCNPGLIERIAAYQTTVHPQRLAHPDVPSRRDAVSDTNLDPETATLVGKDATTHGNGWEVTYTLVGEPQEASDK